ncbi:MAG: AMP-binding protein [Clostridia bacterium]|nr:AMP-binding protein [Clostridia bacterium]
MSKPHSKLYIKTNYANIREVVRAGIEKYPENIAFTIKNKIGKDVEYRDITYKELEQEINNLGSGLLKLGIKDKKVAIIGPNTYEWALSYIAILFGVGIAVPLDKGLPSQEIEDSIIRSEAEVIIFDKKYIDEIKAIKVNNNSKLKNYICMQDINEEGIKTLSDVKELGKIELEKGNREFFNLEIDNEKVSVIIFTSGTTSQSKAVMLSHKNIASDVNSMNAAEKLYSTDVNMQMLPFHHTFSSTGIILMLNNGVKNVFCDGLRYIQSNMKEYKVSVFVCVPLILEAMHKRVMTEVKKKGKEKAINFAKKISKFLLKFKIDIRKKLFKEILDNFGGNMRFVVSGAAAIDKTVAEDFNSWGILTIQGYGLTETSPVVCAENAKYIRYGSVGVPLEDIEIKVDNPDENGIGEFIVKGPNVMLGYYKNEEATKDVLTDGWYHTGDLGYKDKDGYLFITGRKKNVIVLKNGKNIFPEELEELVDKLPYVAESLVFGYPKDDDLVVSVKIVYDENYVKTFMNGISEEELREKAWDDIKIINQDVPKYKHMKKLILTKEPMIKTTTAKVKRFEEIKQIVDQKLLD